MSDAIRFERVTKVYQARQIALADVSFRLPLGSTVGLLGANGSGKSTLLRIAMGLISPSAGDISVFDQPMTPAQNNSANASGSCPTTRRFPAISPPSATSTSSDNVSASITATAKPASAHSFAPWD